jgi:hypothetical protein
MSTNNTDMTESKGHSGTNDIEDIEQVSCLSSLSDINFIELEPNAKLMREASQSYRISSNCDKEKNDEVYSDYYKIAYTESQETGQDFNQIMSRTCPTWNEDKWKSVIQEEKDSQVGDIIETKKLFVCCNSVLNGMYNDTIGVFFNKDTNDYVTYSSNKSEVMQHSGDLHTSYGLRHGIKFLSKDIEGKVGYIISAPWSNYKSKPISELAETRPIFEVCTEDDIILKRYIIPQDFYVGGSKTACVNAEITYSNGIWKVVLMREFINGFADDMKTLITDLRKMNGLVEHDISL